MSDEWDSLAKELLPAEYPRSWSDYDVLCIKVAAGLRSLAAERDVFKMMVSERVQTLHTRLVKAEAERNHWRKAYMKIAKP